MVGPFQGVGMSKMGLEPQKMPKPAEDRGVHCMGGSAPTPRGGGVWGGVPTAPVPAERIPPALRGPRSEPPPPPSPPGPAGTHAWGPARSARATAGPRPGLQHPGTELCPQPRGAQGTGGRLLGRNYWGLGNYRPGAWGSSAPHLPQQTRVGRSELAAGAGLGKANRVRGGAQSLPPSGLGGCRMVLCQVRQGQPRWVRLPARQPNPPVPSLIPRRTRMGPRAVSAQPFPRVPGASGHPQAPRSPVLGPSGCLGAACLCVFVTSSCQLQGGNWIAGLG